MNVAGKTLSIATIVAAVGGVLAIIGVFLTWATATIGGQANDLHGLDSGLNGGKVALVLGILVVLVALAGIFNFRIPQTPIILGVLGVLILVVVALVYFTSILSDASLKDTADMVSAAGGTFGFGIGLILEVVAGVLALVGGGLGMMNRDA